jgi:hypothetical protein
MNGLRSRFSGLTGKLVPVAAGYVSAALLAIAASAVWQAIFRPGGRGSGGMAAFGDSILFLWILGIFSAPATAAALYFLRPCRPFWRLATTVALIISIVAIGDLVATLIPFRSDVTTPLGVWAELVPIRILLAPPLGAGLLVAAAFAPGRQYRYTLAGATAVEAITFVSVFLIWFSGIH